MSHHVTHASVGSVPSAVACCIYPNHRVGWLHTLNRALTRSEAAKEIGIEATLLILAIAMHEDLQLYRVAPTFFFLELQRMLGMRSKTRLERARQQAIDSGWLVMLSSPLGDLAAARYWTVIPDRLNLSDELSPNESTQADTLGFQRGSAACVNPLQTECPILPQVELVQPSSVTQMADEPQAFPAPSAEASDCATFADSARAPEAEVAEPIWQNLAELGASILNQTQDVRQVASKFRHYNSIPMNPVTKAQALALYAAYPQPENADTATSDATREMQALHRALAKTTFAELMPILIRFAALQTRPGADPKLTPPLVTWFDEERWRNVG